MRVDVSYSHGGEITRVNWGPDIFKKLMKTILPLKDFALKFKEYTGPLEAHPQLLGS